MVNGRNKGANAEREIIAILQQSVNLVYEANGEKPPILQRNLEQYRSGGEDIEGLNAFSFEVKRCEVLQLDKWFGQCVDQAMRKQEEIDAPVYPVLLYKQNRKPWRVITYGSILGVGSAYPVNIALDDFLEVFCDILDHNLNKYPKCGIVKT
jgi:hypothetical protein